MTARRLIVPLGAVVRWNWRIAGFAILLGLAAGCSHWKIESRPPAETIAYQRPGRIRVHLVYPDTGPQVVEMRDPEIVGDSLIGWRTRTHQYSTDRTVTEIHERIAVPVSLVRLIEIREFDPMKTVAVLAVGASVTAIVVLAAAVSSYDSSSDPGPVDMSSCPVVWSWDGSGWPIDSGTFGGAIAPALARTDVDNLDHARELNGAIRLRIGNVAAETEHVNSVRLVKVLHAADRTVAPDGDGVLHTLGPLVAAAGARDLSGRDVLPRIRTNDGWMWESNPAEWDTTSPGPLRDAIEMVFPRPLYASQAKLVLDGCHTPWAAAMMQTLVAAHGRETEAWYAALASPQVRQRTEQVFREGFLRVWVRETAGWTRAGEFPEAGPEVSKRQVLALDLSAVAGDSVRVRLESIPSFWLVDQVAIDYTEDAPIESIELPLRRAIDAGGHDVQPLIAGIDDKEYVLETGDTAELEFDSPSDGTQQAFSYLLYTNGWYTIHTSESGDPQFALLQQLARDPATASRLAVGRLHAAVAALHEDRP